MKPHLPRLLTMTLCLEMIMAPLAPAYAQEKPKEKKSLADTLYNGLNKASGVINKSGIIKGLTLPQAGGGAYGADLQMLQQQKQPIQDTEVFNTQLLKSKLPELDKYLASHPASLDCPVLKPLNIVEPEICEPSGAGIPLSPPDQNAYYTAQAKEFVTNFKDIKNLYSDSSDKFQGAMACMTKASNVLDNFFAYRENELNKLSNELKRMHSEFMKGSERERSDIAVQTALLDGSDPSLTKDVDAKLLAQSMKDMKADYDRSACPTIQGFKTDDLQKDGLKSKYTQLEAGLTQKQGPSGFSGSSYTANHSAVVKDLTDMANSSSTLFKESFGNGSSVKGGMTSFLSGLSSQVASQNGANSLLVPGSFTELISSYNTDLLPLSKKQDELLSELGSRADDPAIRSLSDMNSTNFESQIQRLENSLKYDCLARALSTKEASLANIKKKSFDPNTSKYANSASSSIFETKLADILNNSTTSPEEKISLINKAKKDERKIVRQTSKYNVSTLNSEGKQVDTTVSKTSNTASQFYTDVITNCNTQYKSNKLNSSMSGESAISTLRSLRSNYEKLMSKQAKAVGDQIKKKFISCESSAVANSSDAQSCSPERFDTSKPGFCANAAFSCSRNMQACTTKTRMQVEKIETQRTAKVANYNVQAKAHVAALKTLYDKTQKLYENQAKWMQGGFVGLGEIGFSLPLDIERDPKVGKMAGFIDHDVMLDDPEAAMKAFEKNIASLKKEVSSFQAKLKAGIANYKTDKQDLYKKVAKDVTQMEENCQNAINGSGRMMSEENKKTNEILSEFGEKLPEFCRKYGKAKENPSAACKEDVSDLVDTAFKAAQRLGSSTAGDSIAEFKYICEGYGNSSDNSETIKDAIRACPDEKSKNTGVGKKNPYCSKFLSCWTVKKVIETTKTDPNSIQETESVSYEKQMTGCSDEELQVIAEDVVNANGQSTGKVTLAAPVFCEGDDNSMRYNNKYFIPGGLGQQGGGALANGM